MSREQDFTPIEEPPFTVEEQAALDRLAAIRAGAGRIVTVELPLDDYAATEADIAVVEDR